MLRASEKTLERIHKQKAKNRYMKGETDFDKLLSEMYELDEYWKNREFSRDSEGVM